MTPANWIALIGVVSASVAFASGLLQYRRAQHWKRAEFVAAEVKEALRDRWVEVALQLLDSHSRNYDLQKSSAEEELNKVLVTDIDVAVALEPHTIRSGGFSPVEMRIRDAFDALLVVLQRFEHFVSAGLVQSDDYAPYLRYWLKLLGDAKSGRRPPVVVAAIWRFIAYYDYDDVQRFLRRFGYEIRLERSDPDLQHQLESLDKRILPLPEGVVSVAASSRSPAP